MLVVDDDAAIGGEAPWRAAAMAAYVAWMSVVAGQLLTNLLTIAQSSPLLAAFFSRIVGSERANAILADGHPLTDMRAFVPALRQEPAAANVPVVAIAAVERRDLSWDLAGAAVTALELREARRRALQRNHRASPRSAAARPAGRRVRLARRLLERTVRGAAPGSCGAKSRVPRVA